MTFFALPPALVQSASVILQIVFVLLSALHVYWAAGGRRWFEAAVPKVEGKEAFKPSAFATLVVAGGLFLFGVLALFLVFVEVPSLDGVLYVAAWVVAGIFLLRAIGDFRHFGLFKFVGEAADARGTSFSRNDTRIYSPLCLMIAGLFTIIVL